MPHGSLLPHGSSLPPSSVFICGERGLEEEGRFASPAKREDFRAPRFPPPSWRIPHGASLMAHPFLPLCPGCLSGASSEDGPDGIGISATLRHQKEGGEGEKKA